MKQEKSVSKMKQFFDKLRHINQQEHAAKADNAARLNYQKGNFDQEKPKNAAVWDSCPVLDEQGKPVKEN